MKKSVRFIMFQVMAGGASPAMTFIDFEKAANSIVMPPRLPKLQPRCWDAILIKMDRSIQDSEKRK